MLLELWKMTLTIKIDDRKRKSLESIAARKGKKVGEFVEEILDDYLYRENLSADEIQNWMKLSEASFAEWDNEEDAVYDKL
jgi:predicted transcriptional regulator